MAGGLNACWIALGEGLAGRASEEWVTAFSKLAKDHMLEDLRRRGYRSGEAEAFDGGLGGALRREY